MKLESQNMVCQVSPCRIIIYMIIDHSYELIAVDQIWKWLESINLFLIPLALSNQCSPKWFALDFVHLDDAGNQTNKLGQNSTFLKQKQI